MIESCKTVIDLLKLRCLTQPDANAYIFLENGNQSHSFTYRELDNLAKKIASRLNLVTKPGDRVLILYEQGHLYVAAFFGCLYAGRIAVPLYPPRPGRTDSRLQKIMENARPKAAFASLETIKRLKGDTGGIFSAAEFITIDDIESSLDSSFIETIVSGNTIAFLQYTSGSTSLPRGVVVSHSNILANEKMIYKAFGHDGAGPIAGWLPLFHDMGLIGNLLQPLYAAISCVMISPSEFLRKPFRWLEAVSVYNCHTSGGPNFAYDLCTEKINSKELMQIDLRSWKVAFNGSEPIRIGTLKRFADKFKDAGFNPTSFFPCYGLAEATLFVTGNGVNNFPLVFNQSPDKQIGETSLVSSGRPAPGAVIKIVKPDEHTICKECEEGEIWISGPHVAQGYFENDEETSRVFNYKLNECNDQLFLRTGDLGFISNEELFVSGRIKELIIVQGRNFHPRDIEIAAQECHSALIKGGGAAFSLNSGFREMACLIQECSDIVADYSFIMQAVRQAVFEENELILDVIVLIQRFTLPRTSSGKVQRHLAKACYAQKKLKTIAESILDLPSSMVDGDVLKQQKKLKDILALASAEKKEEMILEYLTSYLSILLYKGKDIPGKQTALTAIGLDSLKAFALIDRIENDLEIKLTITELFDNISCEKLAKKLAEKAFMPSGKYNIIEKRDPGIKRIPLTPMQKRLWFMDQLNPQTAVYNVPGLIILRGKLDLPRLNKCFIQLCNLHDIFRTVYISKDGIPFAEIQDFIDFQVENENAANKPLNEILSKATLFCSKPFDLDKLPLIRVKIFKITDSFYYLVLNIHHIIFDGWSMEILFNDIAAYYKDSCLSHHSNQIITYNDYACASIAEPEANNKQLEYWKNKLHNLPVLNLPYDLDRPIVSSMAGDTIYFLIDDELTGKLRDFASGCHASLFTILFAGFFVLIRLLSRQDDFAIATSVTLRDKRELRSIIGLLVNQVLIRQDFYDNPVFKKLVSSVGSATLSAVENKDIPFDTLVNNLEYNRTPGANPLFQLIFVMESIIGSNKIDSGSLEFELAPLEISTGFSRFDSMVCVWEKEKNILVSWEYSLELFKKETIHFLLDSYKEILNECITRPDVPVNLFNFSKKIPDDLILITANFTALMLKEPLLSWLKRINIKAQIQFAPYNQIFQSLLDPDSLFHKTNAICKIILINLEDWLTVPLNRENILKFKSIIKEFISALSSFATSKGGIFIVCLCPGNPLNDSTKKFLLDKTGEELFESCNLIQGVYPVDFKDILKLYPARDYFDAVANTNGHIPYTIDFFSSLAAMISRRLYVIQSKPVKVIVLDCDNTLWKGICGEDGAQGLFISESRRIFQEFLVRRYEAGFLLCLCSKNNEEDVFSVFDSRKDMVLKREHITAFRINWKRKSENILDLSRELNLGIDSFVFLDDNPIEISEVQTAYPNILAFNIPEEDDKLPDFINHLWALDIVKTLSEDKLRNAYYLSDKQRSQLKESSGSFDDFLKNLELEIHISKINESAIERVVQLSERTNQFNSTKPVYTYSQMHSVNLEANKLFLIVSVKDKFSDYGLVGSTSLYFTIDTIVIESFLLSCRALGRRVEHYMLYHIAEIAIEKKINNIDFLYIKTEKNKPVYEFLLSLKTLNNSREEESNKKFIFNTKDLKEQLQIILPVIQAGKN